jgi:thioredoxin 1
MKVISGIEELDNFIVENINNNMITLLYFGATWCGPCKQLKERLHNKDTYKIMPKLSVVYLDVDDMNNEELMKRYKVESLPTQIYIRLNDNRVEEVRRIEGYDFTKLKLDYDYCASL